MIDQLHISNFRGITELKLSGMKRVNLIVGANNVGKTSLLEALALQGMLSNFQEMPGLFRTSPKIESKEFERWMLTKGADEGNISAASEDGLKSLYFGQKYDPEEGPVPDGLAKMGDLHIGWYPLNESDAIGYSCHSISVHHGTPESMIPKFADAVRTPASEKLLESILFKIDDRIRSVRLDYADSHQFISVDLGLTERVPISQAGQGIYRLVSIFSELLGKRPKICLIDEIENGIHWTALPIVWQGIAEIAEALDIQIFATTHSRECLTAAYDVFRKRATTDETDFSVIQLMRIKDKIEGRVLNGAHVEAAIENDIELR